MTTTANGLQNALVYAWEYADAATRNAATGFVAADVGKLARQLDTTTLWMLTATTPTWVQVGGVSSGGGLLAANNLSDVASASTSRTNLGLGTAATKNVPVSGNAASGEAVLGSDTRLSDSRTPTSHDHTSAANDGGVLTKPELDNYLSLAEIATPTDTPAAGKRLVYVKSDGNLYRRNSDGSETQITGTAGTLSSHDHTSAGGDGGVLTNDEHDGYSEYAEIAAPSTPAANKARLYAKDNAGVTALYYKGDNSTEVGPLGAGGGGRVVQLDYEAATDIASGTVLSANTWTDVGTNQTFTVNNASSIVEIAVGGYVQVGTVNAPIASQIVIDSGGTPVTKRLGGDYGNGSYGNALSGAATVTVTGLSAGSHTVKLQVRAGAACNIYCRPATQVPESLHIRVIERLP